MLKPLTKEQTDSIIRNAAEEFANKGFSHAAIGSIAKKSQVSVGVIYKYYEDKKDLFNACVVRSLEALDEVFRDVQDPELSMLEAVDRLIRQIQKFARKNPEYFRLYHQITVSGSPELTDHTAELIEGRSAELYRGVLEKAKASGDVRGDLDPSLFAFFFDNLLMMLHFSYTCGYYEDRFKVFCGDDIDKKDDLVREQMMMFIGGALNGVHTGI